MKARGPRWWPSVAVKRAAVTAACGAVRRAAPGGGICRAAGFSSTLVTHGRADGGAGGAGDRPVEALISPARADGPCVLLFSHNFDQVLRLADQVWVMPGRPVRGGRRVAQTSGAGSFALITGAQAA